MAATTIINVALHPYNAAGDGTTNDTAAIQAALDAAALISGGVCVYVPAGTYLIDRTGSTNWCLRWPYTVPAVTSVGILASNASGTTITLATPGDAANVNVGSWVTFYDNDGAGGGPGTKRTAGSDYARYVQAVNLSTGVLTLTTTASTLGAVTGDHVVLDPGSSFITLKGDGNGTVIKLSSVSTTSDLYMLAVDRHAEHGTICDITFDGSFPLDTPVGSTTEQNHAVRLGQGANGDGCQFFRIDRCTFIDVRGDGIQLLGTVPEPVRHVTISNSLFDACHRSGVGVNRGIHELTIVSNHFRRTNDQDIDFEPSGTVGENSNTVIGFNHIDHSHKHGNVALTLTGVGASDGDRNVRCSVIGNTIIDGCVSALNIEDMNFCDNQMSMRGADTADPMVKFYRGVEGARISGNTFIRQYGVGADGATTTAGQVVNVSANRVEGPDGEVVIYSPNNIIISNNIIRQYSPAGCIYCENGNDIHINDNQVLYYVNETNQRSAIVLNPALEAMSGATLKGNVVHGGLGSGTLENGIKVGSSSYACDKVIISGNTIDGCTGAEIKLNGAMTTAPIVTDNLVSADVASVGNLIQIGGQGSRRIFQGSGTPQGVVTAGIGSQFQRTDGGAGTTLYVKESGTGNTGWIEK
jgi:Pectate lyase superfamily protein